MTDTVQSEDVDGLTAYPWAYECENCGDVVTVERVGEHSQEHVEESGMASMTRVEITH